MRRLLFIILLLFSFTAYGQSYVSGERQPLYDTGADSLFTRLTADGITISNDRKTFISNIFTMIKDSLNITYLGGAFDLIYFFDTGDSSAKYNWVKGSHNITNIGATFDSTGVVGNGSSQYLNTNYNASTQAVNFLQNSNSTGVYVSTDVVEYSTIFGFRDGGLTERYELQVRLPESTQLYTHNLSLNLAVISASSIGLFATERHGADSCFIYKRGSSDINVGSGRTSTSIPSFNMYILAKNLIGSISDYSTQKARFFFSGKSFTYDEFTKIYNIVLYWQQNKNANP